MTRFGAEGCPAFHGIASCVDYLCGYLGAWAGVSALAARERRKDGTGDWAESSLAAAATLVQLLLQRTQEPPSARGSDATGLTAGERTYRVSDGWVFARAARDVSAELAPMTVAAALAHLASQGIDATPIQTLRELVDRHRTGRPRRSPSRSASGTDGKTKASRQPGTPSTACRIRGPPLHPASARMRPRSSRRSATPPTKSAGSQRAASSAPSSGFIGNRPNLERFDSFSAPALTCVLMTHLRRVLAPVTAIWLFCQVGAVALVPAALWITAADSHGVECTCGHGLGAICPMHHKPADDPAACAMKAANTGTAVLTTLDRHGRTRYRTHALHSTANSVHLSSSRRRSPRR